MVRASSEAVDIQDNAGSQDPTPSLFVYRLKTKLKGQQVPDNEVQSVTYVLMYLHSRTIV
jgi:hypothetical protein